MAHTINNQRTGKSASTTRSAMIITGTAKDEQKQHQGFVEPTYKMKPDKHFPSTSIEAVIKDVLEEAFDGKKYDREQCNNRCVELANTIKSRVKSLNPPRYKVVTFVVVGEETMGSVKLASRCVWNDKFDNYSEYCYRNGSIYAVGMVYGLFAE